MLIGCDVRSIDSETLRILTNDEIISISQDKLGVQGNKRKIHVSDSTEVWAGPLADGSKAVILLNRGTEMATITAEWSDIGLDNTMVCKDNSVCMTSCVI